jgi:signal transduction histidine kinase
MNQFTRIGSSMVLLVVLLLGALALNDWLHRQTQNQIHQLNDAAVDLKRTQFHAATARSNLAAAEWTQANLTELGRGIGATVTLQGDTAAISPAGLLSFTEGLGADGTGRTRVVVSFPPPPAARLMGLYHRVTLVLLLLCPALFTGGFLIATLARRRLPDDRASRTPWAFERKQALGIEHFAKISNERGAALAQEQGARLRAEEDLQLNRTLLDNSVAERVRLGRELHDNISQTLYAVCLTLESVQKKGGLATELQRRVDHCMGELRRLNQEVRTYLQELEPAQVTSSSFATALNDLVGSFAASEEVHIEQRLDEEAVALIAPGHIAEIMNILREAVSNSLRHGHAQRITLLAGRSDQTVALAVQDDGAGFTPGINARGHGLGNMQARAAALGAGLRIESTTGKGTRVLLTLPVASSA